MISRKDLKKFKEEFQAKKDNKTDILILVHESTQKSDFPDKLKRKLLKEPKNGCSSEN